MHFKEFIIESITYSDLEKAMKKSKDDVIMIMTSSGKHFSVSKDALEDSEGEDYVFADDEDGESHEIMIKNISKIS